MPLGNIVLSALTFGAKGRKKPDGTPAFDAAQFAAQQAKPPLLAPGPTVPAAPMPTTMAASAAMVTAQSAQQRQRKRAASGSLIGTPLVGSTRATAVTKPGTLVGTY